MIYKNDEEKIHSAFIEKCSHTVRKYVRKQFVCFQEEKASISSHNARDEENEKSSLKIQVSL